MKTTYESTFKGLKINTNPYLGYGAYVDILEGIHRQLANLLSHHSRINVVRLDIRIGSKKTYDPKKENQQIRAFLKMLKANLALKRWGGHKRIAHAWVREVGKTDHGHYHIFIAFKSFTKRMGKISRDGYSGLWELIRRCSQQTIGVNPRFCLKVHSIERHHDENLDSCFYHLSYLAKTRDKSFGTGLGIKGFDFSRIKPKPATNPEMPS